MPRVVLDRGRRTHRRSRRQTHSYLSPPRLQIEHSIPTTDYFENITPMRRIPKHDLAMMTPPESPKQEQATVPLTLHPPFFEIGDQVLYNQAGYRTKDEIGPATPFSWRQWRTYIVCRNEFLNSAGKWMYQIVEIGGEAKVIAAEEHLIEIQYPPMTRVVLADESVAKGGMAKWVVKSCRINTVKSNDVSYDLLNERGGMLRDVKFDVMVGDMVPYMGPKPDEEGNFMED